MEEEQREENERAEQEKNSRGARRRERREEGGVAPVGNRAAALDVNKNASALDLAPVRVLVCCLHVFLVLVLYKGIAPRLGCFPIQNLSQASPSACQSSHHNLSKQRLLA